MSAKQPRCLECNTAYSARAAHQRFCSPSCSKAFNNRRMTRGAELYDYYMSMRYERDTHSGNIAIMNQMAMRWRDEDRASREGRQSWATPDLSADPRAFDIIRRARTKRTESA